MIAFKDIPMLLGIVSTAVGSGVYIHDLRRDVTELGTDYRQHVAAQQETTLTERKWSLEDRVRERPDDVRARRELEDVNRLLDKNQRQQEQLKGGK